MVQALAERGEVRAVDVAAPSDQAFAAAAAALRDAGIETLSSDATTLFSRHRLELLSAEQIRAQVSATTRLTQLDLRIATGSTNADALISQPPAVDTCVARLAEFQTIGEGRRGARWRSPFASGLCLTLATRIVAGRNLSTLPLACGVAVRRALANLGVASVQIKWPNDVIVNERKLGGLLMQMRQLPGEPSLLVIGLGLNVLAVPEAVDAQALSPVSIKHCLGDATPTRSQVAASMIDALWSAVSTFARDGFAAFQNEWEQADFLHGRAVSVHDDKGRRDGIARGVNEQGELLVDMDNRIVAVNAGTVSVRPQR